MKPASATNSTLGLTGSSGLHNFRSPIPYLFGGLALMLALIAVALLILACSFRKGSPSSSAVDEEKPTQMVKMEGEFEPKIVVIMAGDTNPTYLANPVLISPSSAQTEQTV